MQLQAFGVKPRTHRKGEHEITLRLLGSQAEASASATVSAGAGAVSRVRVQCNMLGTSVQLGSQQHAARCKGLAGVIMGVGSVVVPKAPMGVSGH